MTDSDRYRIMLNSRLALAVDASLCLVVETGAPGARSRATVSDLAALERAIDELRCARDTLRNADEATRTAPSLADALKASLASRPHAADVLRWERVRDLPISLAGKCTAPAGCGEYTRVVGRSAVLYHRPDCPVLIAERTERSARELAEHPGDDRWVTTTPSQVDADDTARLAQLARVTAETERADEAERERRERERERAETERADARARGCGSGWECQVSRDEADRERRESLGGDQ